MPATISRLLMCFGVLIGAVMVYILTYATLERPWNDRDAFLTADVATCVFIMASWTLIWRSAVHWSHVRLTMTVALIPASLLITVILFAMSTTVMPEEAGIILSSFTYTATWLIGTAIIWRENAKERGERLRQLGLHAVACPDCGYNLTGLHEAKCPECGAAYTLDQLFATITEQRAELGGE